ncbi:hypothetical protein I4F81_010205 [Pyropia yezoensis]|uniref:Uncharacterized protein n=1 Tax=Pyropia yezoensis TaxID=2788 RepID=A0ACC3CC71_PYRYE|nr:hypothetical protein I4F81_010205 [Neopyropia yezoensis]
MSAAVRFRPLYGAEDGAGAPVASLLEVDDLTILLDCGWDPCLEVSFGPAAAVASAAEASPSPPPPPPPPPLPGGQAGAPSGAGAAGVIPPPPLLPPSPHKSSSSPFEKSRSITSQPPVASPSHILTALRSVAPTVNAVLLSSSAVRHLGALAAIAPSLPAATKVYATLPTWRLGQMTLYDAHDGLVRRTPPPHAYDLDGVDGTFESRFVTLKYQQGVRLAEGVTVTPFAAGRVLGGTVWSVRVDSEEVVYAPVFNHRRERLLNPSAMGTLARPSTLIVGAGSQPVGPSAAVVAAAAASGTVLTPAPYVPPAVSAAAVVELVVATLRRGGDVLLPTDTAGRVLELALALEEAWEASKGDLTPFPIVMLHCVAFNTVELAKSMIEWASDAVVDRFDNARQNVFAFNHVACVHDRRDVDALRSPKVILATADSLQSGHARALLLELAGGERNAVLLTSPPVTGSIAAGLVGEAVAARGAAALGGASAAAGGGGVLVGPTFSMDLVLPRKVRLEGSALRAWRAEREAVRRAAAAAEDAAAEEEAAVAAEAAAEAEAAAAAAAVATDGEDSGGDADAMVVDGVAAAKNVDSRDADCAAAPANGRPRGGRRGSARHAQGGSGDDGQRGDTVDSNDEEEDALEGLYPPAPLLFPFTPTERQWDDYGEVVDVRQFMIGEDPGDPLSEDEEEAIARAAQADPMVQDGEEGGGGGGDGPAGRRGVGGGSASAAAGSGQGGDDGDDSAPYHYILQSRRLTVRCGVGAVDFDGTADGKSVRKIVADVAPRRVLVVHGTAAQRAALREYALRFIFHAAAPAAAAAGGGGEAAAPPPPTAGSASGADAATRQAVADAAAVCPADGVTVDVTSVTSVYRVTLRDALMRGLTWAPVGGGADIAYVDAVVRTEAVAPRPPGTGGAGGPAGAPPGPGGSGLVVPGTVGAVTGGGGIALDVPPDEAGGGGAAAVPGSSGGRTGAGLSAEAADVARGLELWGAPPPSRLLAAHFPPTPGGGDVPGGGGSGDVAAVAGAVPPPRAHPTVFVGAVKMNELRSIVRDGGLDATFAGGALVVAAGEGGLPPPPPPVTTVAAAAPPLEPADAAAVLVKKTADAGGVLLEGTLSEEYYAVRDLLYQQYVRLAG